MKKRFLDKLAVNRYIVLFVAMALLGVFLFTIERMESYYAHQVFENAVEFKKSYLHQTVNNLVSDIDASRRDTVNMYDYIIQSGHDYVKEHVAKEGPSAVVKYLNDQIGKTGWVYFIYEKGTYRIIEDKLAVMPNDWDGNEAELKNVFAAFNSVPYKNTVIVYGVLKQLMDNMITEMYREKIHSYYGNDDSYIWINKVIDWNGGHNYAYRLVHPNLIETEGMFLSTDMQDSVGNYPYLDELEGIKNNEGEYFYSYYFIKKDSDVVERKLSYAKLYPDYNWIVCMGVYYDDIERGISDSSSSLRKGALRIAIPVVSILLMLLLLALFLQIYSDQKNLTLTTKKSLRKADFDELTRANSKQFGEEELEFAYRKFINGITASPAIMMMGVDHFRVLNDTYGYEEGDVVLKKVVACVYEVIRNSDILIRWNGDEFVGVFYGINRGNIDKFADKILSSVSDLSVDYKGTAVHVTVSLGFSFYDEEDMDYEVAVRRADNAMYEAKRNGRNQYRIR